ncbi:hypothetical protein [Micromonospora sp. WMMD1082]|uniref:hypothetical protein n=1 Tax=Micromonospora sp. WMMD1082 TaxID=3016104 RepID=UPI0024160296|nr:hypothetical protein [Micromonospora sp. WMMD1082]MDG4795201.1 hypothetical protein [Micromonospora sp. WMMD1082]
MDSRPVLAQAEDVSRQVVIALSADPPNQSAFLHAFRGGAGGLDPVVAVAVLHTWARGAALLGDRDAVGRLSWLPRGGERYRRAIWAAAREGDNRLQQQIAAALLRLSDRQVSLLLAWYAHAFTHTITEVCGGYRAVEDIAGFLDGYIPARDPAGQAAVLLVAALAAGNTDLAERALTRITGGPDADTVLTRIDAIVYPAMLAALAGTRRLLGTAASAGLDLPDDDVATHVWAHAGTLARLLPPLIRQLRT